jgi:hypothetical protein
MDCFVGEAKLAAGIAALVGERIEVVTAADFRLRQIDALNQSDLGDVMQLLIFATTEVLRLAELVPGMHPAERVLFKPNNRTDTRARWRHPFGRTFGD